MDAFGCCVMGMERLEVLYLGIRGLGVGLGLGLDLGLGLGLGVLRMVVVVIANGRLQGSISILL